MPERVFETAAVGRQAPMTTNQANSDNAAPDGGTAAKDPDQWITGDEPMTGPQASYLATLAHEAGEDPPPDDLTKADASKRIDELQDRTGRGQ